MDAVYSRGAKFAAAVGAGRVAWRDWCYRAQHTQVDSIGGSDVTCRARSFDRGTLRCIHTNIHTMQQAARAVVKITKGLTYTRALPSTRKSKTLPPSGQVYGSMCFK